MGEHGSVMSTSAIEQKEINTSTVGAQVNLPLELAKILLLIVIKKVGIFTLPLY
jgi:hypothetical protein